jgi:crotonobetainyl-CoA:carnitine CoA-transferase CaiB-like acyl-CoA transferase
MSERSGPLASLRVLDAGNLVAGPMAACLLGDLGADVIKLEHPVLSDPLREWGPQKDGVSLWWKVINRNKRLVTLNLSTGDGQRLAGELVRWADVVIENFRPGTFERWNLGYERLSEINPGVILVRLSGYGQTGPYARRPGYGTIAEAMSGIVSFTGFPDRPPTLPGFPMADTTAAVFAAMAALAADRHRRESGRNEGQEIDVSLYESLFRLVDSQVIGYDQVGLIKQRSGNRMEEDAPRNAYRTSDDRWIAISASSNRTWSRLAEAIGRPELGDDERFNTGPKRVANVDPLDEILEAWFASLTADESMRKLEEHDVVAGPVLDITEIFEHPQYGARENIIDVEDPTFGTVKMQGVVPKFSATPGAVRFPGLDPGAHSHEVFRDVLGLDDDEIRRLEAEQVI